MSCMIEFSLELKLTFLVVRYDIKELVKSLGGERC